MKNVSILIPYRPDNGPRDKAFEWMKKYYQALMPEAELCIGSCRYRIFSRSQAINDAATKATRDVFVIVDSDIFCDPKIVEESIKLLDQHPWIIPFNTTHMLSEKSTNEIYSTEPKFPLQMNLESTIKGACHGRMNIVPRKYFERVGGFDGRFCGWGGEDDAFAYSMDTLCGQHKRLDYENFHLWHPRRSGQGGLKDYNPIYQLFLRYKSANGNPVEMQHLIDERKTDLCGQCYEV